MNKEELVEFLKENLKLNINEETEMYSGTVSIRFQLALCDEVISEDWVTIDAEA